MRNGTEKEVSKTKGKTMNLLLLLLFSLNSNAAGLPDIIQNFSVTFNRGDCVPGGGPGYEFDFTPPPPGYDTGYTTWDTEYVMRMQVTNFSGVPGYVIQRDYQPGVQARMPLSVGILSSTAGPYPQYPLSNYVDLLPFETKLAVRSISVPYANDIQGIESMVFTSDKITFHCQSAINSTFESDIPFGKRYLNGFTWATLELVWQDLH